MNLSFNLCTWPNNSIRLDWTKIYNPVYLKNLTWLTMFWTQFNLTWEKNTNILSIHHKPRTIGIRIPFHQLFVLIWVHRPKIIACCMKIKIIPSPLHTVGIVSSIYPAGKTNMKGAKIIYTVAFLKNEKAVETEPLEWILESTQERYTTLDLLCLCE